MSAARHAARRSRPLTAIMIVLLALAGLAIAWALAHPALSALARPILMHYHGHPVGLHFHGRLHFHG